jgi:hypothetical protein
MTDQNGKCCQRNAMNSRSEDSVNGELPAAGFVSEYDVPKMDCPSEEGMIRLALESAEPSVVLEFDTPNRKVRIFHGVDIDTIEQRMQSVGLGARRERTMPMSSEAIDRAQGKSEKETGVLKWLLAINGVMFLVELVVGWWAQSTGLIADSLDMFADAAVYGVALYAVGHSAQMKLRAAHFSGWLQVILALGALSEVVRRFLYGSEPDSNLMMSFGLVALAANVLCLVLITKHREGGVHMKASWIFSANDVIANSCRGPGCLDGVSLSGFDHWLHHCRDRSERRLPYLEAQIGSM